MRPVIGARRALRGRSALDLRCAILLLVSAAGAAGCGEGGADISPPSCELPGASDSPTAALLDGPEDWRDEVIYFVMTDRFADGDDTNNGAPAFLDRGDPFKYHGGDLQGIRDHVDYLTELGVTALWITPVVENVIAVGSEPDVYTGYHGYSAHDLTALDSHLGASIEDYRAFVEEMHDSGIRVVQDIVVNHMGDLLVYDAGWTPPFRPEGYPRSFIEDMFPPATNPWVAEQLSTRPSTCPFDQLEAYHRHGSIDWNRLTDEMMVLGDFLSLDDLATEEPLVRDALVQVYSDWISQAGVDGFRIDTVAHVEEEFWDQFPARIREHVHSMNPAARFMQFGEVVGRHDEAGRYTGSGAEVARIDSMLNYELYFAIRRVFAEGAPTSELGDEIRNRAALRGTPSGPGGSGLSARSAPVNFIDNHDRERFLDTVTTELEPSRKAAVMRNALMYLMTTEGIPCIYYNTENDTVGDPAAPPGLLIPGEYGRVDMPDFETAGKPTFALIRELAALRREQIALRRGAIEVLADSNSTDGEGRPVPPGTFAFSRKLPDEPGEDLFVLLNTSEVDAVQDIFVGTDDVLREIHPAPDSIDHAPDQGRVAVTVPAYGMTVLKRPGR